MALSRVIEHVDFTGQIDLRSMSAQTPSGSLTEGGELALSRSDALGDQPARQMNPKWVHSAHHPYGGDLIAKVDALGDQSARSARTDQWNQTVKAFLYSYSASVKPQFAITTGWRGRSPPSVSNPSIRLMISNPFTTMPKTTCFPSK